MVTIQTVPVTTPEEPVEQDDTVALHTEVKPHVEQDDAVALHTEVKPPVEVVEHVLTPLEIPTPKRKGRPVGSKSKEPGKPRAPRIKRVVVEEPAPNVVEEERVLPGSSPIPTHAYDTRTAMMLEMLQLQANERKHRKAALYKSWFR